MTDEEKRLLLIDLCGRMPYGVKVENTSFSEPQIQTLFGRIDDDVFIMKETYKSVGVSGDDFGTSYEKRCIGYLEFIKPYIRPISSMTDEEFLTLYDMCSNKVFQFRGHPTYYSDFKTKRYVPNFIYDSNQLDYLISHHFDYRGLIEKGLALEAPEDMYKIE